MDQSNSQSINVNTAGVSYVSKPLIVGDEKTRFLQKILRGEISAIEAYDKVLDRREVELSYSTLFQIRTEHNRTVGKLKKLIEEKGELPDDDSGVWGQFVKTLIAGTALISDEIILKTLIEGEEHGLKEYRQFLDMNLSVYESDLMRFDFIPMQERHIELLKELERE